MPVVRCPGCDRQLNVPDTAQRVKCPQCSHAFAISSDGITAGAPAASLAAAPATMPAPTRSRPERDEQPAERGRETLVVIILSVVAALVLFAIVGGAATWFLFAINEDVLMMDPAPHVHEVMIEEKAEDPAPVEIDPEVQPRIEPEKAK